MPEPGPGELLIRVDAATTCGTDVKVYRRGGHPTMLALPSPFGHEVTGTVVRAAAGTRRHTEGDGVVVANSASCGKCQPCRHNRENLCRNLVYLNGAFTDYLLIPEAVAKRSVHTRPAGLEPVVAAMAEPLACAVHCLERCLGAWSGPPNEGADPSHRLRAAGTHADRPVPQHAYSGPRPRPAQPAPRSGTCIRRRRNAARPRR